MFTVVLKPRCTLESPGSLQIWCLDAFWEIELVRSGTLGNQSFWGSPGDSNCRWGWNDYYTEKKDEGKTLALNAKWEGISFPRGVFFLLWIAGKVGRWLRTIPRGAAICRWAGPLPSWAREKRMRTTLQWEEETVEVEKNAWVPKAKWTMWKLAVLQLSFMEAHPSGGQRLVCGSRRLDYWWWGSWGLENMGFQHRELSSKDTTLLGPNRKWPHGCCPREAPKSRREHQQPGRRDLNQHKNKEMLPLPVSLLLFQDTRDTWVWKLRQENYESWTRHELENWKMGWVTVIEIDLKLWNPPKILPKVRKKVS